MGNIFDHANYKYSRNESQRNINQDSNLIKIFLNHNNKLNPYRSFKINNFQVFTLSYLLEQIDESLFIDIGKDIQAFYNLYFENLSEPQIPDHTLRQFCYYRINSMIKDILFRDITRNFKIPLIKILKIFSRIFNDDMRIPWNKNIIHKDYVTQLKINLKFINNTSYKSNNSIETLKVIRSQVKNSIGNNQTYSIQSIICNIYLRLLSLFSIKKQKITYEDFQYGLNITQIFLYLIIISNEQHSLIDIKNLINKEKHEHITFNTNNISLLLTLISYKNLDITHKVLSFFDTIDSDIIFRNDAITNSYILMYKF